MIKRTLSDNLEFLIASLAYVISHVIDYLLTVQGITENIAKEGNPVIREYISLFGVKGGLLVYKSLICGGIILGMKAIDSLRRRQKTRFRAEYILYGGAALTALGGCLWLLPHDSVVRLFTLLKMVP
jgi:hypothetical protein